MSAFKVALLQINSFGLDQEKNCEKGLEYCKKVAALGADFALFPEMWNMGYTKNNLEDPEEQKKISSYAINSKSDFISQYKNLAKELGLGIGITYLNSESGRIKNSISLINKEGEVILTYSKVHTCDFDILEVLTTPGDDFYVKPFQIDNDTHVNLGAMICYDREFPESARTLMLKGAEIVLTPNSCKLNDLRIDQFKTRAFENAMGVAMTNYPAPKNNGRSIAYNAKGELIFEAGDKEDVYMVEFDIDEIRKTQSSTLMGNAFRRPHRYELLSSMNIEEVFIRKNALKKDFIRSER